MTTAATEWMTTLSAVLSVQLFPRFSSVFRRKKGKAGRTGNINLEEGKAFETLRIPIFGNKNRKIWKFKKWRWKKNVEIWMIRASIRTTLTRHLKLKVRSPRPRLQEEQACLLQGVPYIWIMLDQTRDTQGEPILGCGDSMVSVT